MIRVHGKKRGGNAMTEERIETEKKIIERKIEPEKKTIESKVETGIVGGCLKLNLREKPTTQSKSLAILSKGDKVKILNSPNADWVQVQVPSMGYIRGYCVKKYISLLTVEG